MENMMENFAQAMNKNLLWIQPKALQRRFELRDEEMLVAALEFKSSYGSLAAATTAEENWTFKRVGFFNPRVTVRRSEEEIDLAVYRPKWTGTQGVLEFTAGRSYIWKVANFWATRYEFLDSAGQPLLAYQSGIEHGKLSDLFKNQARVEILPTAHGLPELPLLVLLGWYLIVLSQEDSAVAATAATSGAVVTFM